MLISKGATAIVTLVAVGGGVTLGSYFSGYDEPEKETISYRLADDGLDINVSDWRNILKLHNEIQDTANTFKSEKTQQLNEDDLQNSCATILRELSNNHSNYKLAKRWCVKEQSVSEILSKLGLNLLKTNEKDDDEKHWKGIVAKVKDIPVISTKLGVVSNAQDDSNITSIKAKCAKIIGVKTTNEEFDVNLGIAKNWCSVKKNNV